MTDELLPKIGPVLLNHSLRTKKLASNNSHSVSSPSLHTISFWNSSFLHRQHSNERFHIYHNNPNWTNAPKAHRNFLFPQHFHASSSTKETPSTLKQHFARLPTAPVTRNAKVERRGQRWMYLFSLVSHTFRLLPSGAKMDSI